MTATAQSETAAVRVDPALLPQIKALRRLRRRRLLQLRQLHRRSVRLSEGDATFPRRIIRYAQVGMKDELLASKELWTCYACGECSETCPRQAEPSEFMAASRRYATASYDRTRIARFLYLQPLLGTMAAIAFACLPGRLHVRQPRGAGARGRDGLLRVDPRRPRPRHGHRGHHPRLPRGPGGRAHHDRQDGPGQRHRVARPGRPRRACGRWARPCGQSLAVESLGQKRYREDCESEERALPWYRRTWVMHAAAMFGFLGLLARDHARLRAGDRGPARDRARPCPSGTPCACWARSQACS